ncbi:MAG: hypothetical protein ACXU9K_13985, partial [Thermodesulfobacteriota bacterium]
MNLRISGRRLRGRLYFLLSVGILNEDGKRIGKSSKNSGQMPEMPQTGRLPDRGFQTQTEKISGLGLLVKTTS